jgi:hypothetical protein
VAKIAGVKAVLDIFQTGTIVVIGGGLIYVVLQITRMITEFNAAAARCWAELAEPLGSASKQSANKAEREHRDDRPSATCENPPGDER